MSDLTIEQCYFCERTSAEVTYFEPFAIPCIRTGALQHVVLCAHCIGEHDNAMALSQSTNELVSAR